MRQFYWFMYTDHSLSHVAKNILEKNTHTLKAHDPRLRHRALTNCLRLGDTKTHALMSWPQHWSFSRLLTVWFHTDAQKNADIVLFSNTCACITPGSRLNQPATFQYVDSLQCSYCSLSQTFWQKPIVVAQRFFTRRVARYKAMLHKDAYQV